MRAPCLITETTFLRIDAGFCACWFLTVTDTKERSDYEIMVFIKIKRGIVI